MKKFAISLLVLALAFGVAASASVGVRSDLAAGIGGGLSNVTAVYGVNSQIDVLFTYGTNSIQVANGTQNKTNTTLGLGVNYWINKVAGVELAYGSVTPATFSATAGTAVTTLALSAVAKVELLKGFTLGWRVPVYTSVSAPSGFEGAQSLLINSNTAYVQVDLF